MYVHSIHVYKGVPVILIAINIGLNSDHDSLHSYPTLYSAQMVLLIYESSIIPSYNIYKIPEKVEQV